MGMVETISKSPEETKKIGQELGKQISQVLKNKPSDNFVIGLCGDLGGGKTTFIKGIAKGLGIKKIITSPTFVLLKEYKTSVLRLYHFDFYRLKNIKDALNIGTSEYLKKPGDVALIEWAEKIMDILPKEKLIIEFDFVTQNQRKLIFKPFGKKYKGLVKKTLATSH
jgi:tRNA threonylcarbamoyladenosine biosynthesis protein TsaE